jgi:hypothetical protein
MFEVDSRLRPYSGESVVEAEAVKRDECPYVEGATDYSL